jgi:hypothetical protein
MRPMADGGEWGDRRAGEHQAEQASRGNRHAINPDKRIQRQGPLWVRKRSCAAYHLLRVRLNERALCLS